MNNKGENTIEDKRRKVRWNELRDAIYAMEPLDVLVWRLPPTAEEVGRLKGCIHNYINLTSFKIFCNYHGNFAYLTRALGDRE